MNIKGCKILSLFLALSTTSVHPIQTRIFYKFIKTVTQNAVSQHLDIFNKAMINWAQSQKINGILKARAQGYPKATQKQVEACESELKEFYEMVEKDAGSYKDMTKE